MKWFCLALVGLAQAFVSSIPAAEQVAAPPQHPFKYERFDAQAGALYRSQGSNADYDDSVSTVFLDSKRRVWVGTVTGLAVYDDKKWTSRTFEIPGLNLVGRLLGVKERGPTSIVEGPQGGIWLGGDFGVWRFRDGRYEEVKSSPEIAGMLAMAVDPNGSLWVVTKRRVFRYDGQTWSTALCPYIGNPKSIETPGLHSIAIETNGNVWIGGTVYGEPKGPWEHEGPNWVVDQTRKRRGAGPPMAPLFEFNEKGWRAFGPPHGLDVKWPTPKLDESKRLRVWTSSTKQLIREGETWKPVKGVGDPSGSRWELRRKNGRTELLFQDGEHHIEVRPADHQTGKVLDLGADQMASLYVVEDQAGHCVWLGTWHGLYRIWREELRR